MSDNGKTDSGPAALISEAEVRNICSELLSSKDLDGKRVLIVAPDHTRTCPMDLLFRVLYELMADRVSELNILIALGTHPAMSDEQIYERFGITAEEHQNQFPKARFHNHMWKDPQQLASLGTIPAADISALSDGLFEMDVDITCNRMILDHDLLLVTGPVFPHEVVGFSGGNKYFFPGIAGQEIIDFFHWLGALITNPGIIGHKHTAVRKVVDRAAAMIPVERAAICMVVSGGGLAGLYAGTPEDAWSRAADLSSELHIEWHDRTYHTVLSCAPRMYDDLWTGGKCMYKIEPVVADGGRVIIYAPHITEVSEVHGHIIEEVGYHTRDYFVKQWDRFKHHPWGVLAHSTHVRGVGHYENGEDHGRVDVILATGIPEAMCHQINMGYMDHREIDAGEYMNREAEGILYVPKAGEKLFRTRPSA